MLLTCVFVILPGCWFPISRFPEKKNLVSRISLIWFELFCNIFAYTSNESIFIVTILPTGKPNSYRINTFSYQNSSYELIHSSRAVMYERKQKTGEQKKELSVNVKRDLCNMVQVKLNPAIFSACLNDPSSHPPSSVAAVLLLIPTHLLGYSFSHTLFVITFTFSNSYISRSTPYIKETINLGKYRVLEACEQIITSEE